MSTSKTRNKVARAVARVALKGWWFGYASLGALAIGVASGDHPITYVGYSLLGVGLSSGAVQAIDHVKTASANKQQKTVSELPPKGPKK